MTYEEVVDIIEEIPKFTTKNPLEETKGFYQFLQTEGSGCNFSEAQLGKIIHVAGTNGKGSVCAFLQSICLQAGRKVGMFTSPHLVTTRERFQINGRMVSEKAFVESYEMLCHYLKEYRTLRPQYQPTYFETLFFMMILLFHTQALDYLILETGLGGRLDTTNVIEHPAVCVITEIGFDHMAYLGDTIEQIAAEKAGIIKKGAPVVFVDRKEEASQIIQNKIKENGCLCTKVSRNVYKIRRIQKKSIDFSVSNRYYEYSSLTLHTSALYQVENAVAAMSAVAYLEDAAMTKAVVQKGISSMKWPGRMEEVLPYVYVDGAHNEDGIDAFVQSLQTLFVRQTYTIVFSAVNDKRYESMIQKVCALEGLKSIVVTQIPGSRGVELQTFVDEFHKYTDKEIHAYEELEGATEYALSNRGDREYVFFVGSLYLVGMLKDYLKRRCEKGLEHDKF